MSGSKGRIAAYRSMSEWQVWAVHDSSNLSFDLINISAARGFTSQTSAPCVKQKTRLEISNGAIFEGISGAGL